MHKVDMCSYVLVFIFPYSYVKCLITNYNKLDFSHQVIFSIQLETQKNN